MAEASLLMPRKKVGPGLRNIHMRAHAYGDSGRRDNLAAHCQVDFESRAISLLRLAGALRPPEKVREKRARREMSRDL